MKFSNLTKVMALFAVLTLVLQVSDADAGRRGRKRCRVSCYQPCRMVYYQPCYTSYQPCYNSCQPTVCEPKCCETKCCKQECCETECCKGEECATTSSRFKIDEEAASCSKPKYHHDDYHHEDHRKGHHGKGYHGGGAIE